MSTVAEIKAAIDQLSPREQDEVKTYLHQRMAEDWNRNCRRTKRRPASVKKLAEAAQGRFLPGNSQKLR